MLSRVITVSLTLLWLNAPAWAGDGAVTAKRALLRAGPDKASATVSTIPAGTALEILGSEAAFLQVQLPSGKVGWIAEQLVKRPPPVVAEPPPVSAPPTVSSISTSTSAESRTSEPAAAQPPPPAVAAPSSPLPPPPLWRVLTLLLTGGLLGFAGGYAYRERYYRQRLHGLRV